MKVFGLIRNRDEECLAANYYYPAGHQACCADMAELLNIEIRSDYDRNDTELVSVRVDGNEKDGIAPNAQIGQGWQTLKMNVCPFCGEKITAEVVENKTA